MCEDMVARFDQVEALLNSALRLLRYYRTRPHYAHEDADGGIGATNYVIGVHRIAAAEATAVLLAARHAGYDPSTKDYTNGI